MDVEATDQGERGSLVNGIVRRLCNMGREILHATQIQLEMDLGLPKQAHQSEHTRHLPSRESVRSQTFHMVFSHNRCLLKTCNVPPTWPGRAPMLGYSGTI